MLRYYLKFIANQRCMSLLVVSGLFVLAIQWLTLLYATAFSFLNDSVGRDLNKYYEFLGSAQPTLFCDRASARLEVNISNAVRIPTCSDYHAPNHELDMILGANIRERVRLRIYSTLILPAKADLFWYSQDDPSKDIGIGLAQFHEIYGQIAKIAKKNGFGSTQFTCSSGHCQIPGLSKIESLFDAFSGMELASKSGSKIASILAPKSNSMIVVENPNRLRRILIGLLWLNASFELQGLPGDHPSRQEIAKKFIRLWSYYLIGQSLRPNSICYQFHCTYKNKFSQNPKI